MRSPSTGTLKTGPSTGTESEDERGSAGPSKTHPVVKGETAPRLPHERDESSDSGTGAPSDLMKNAHDDQVSDKQPTDRSAATDEVYGRTLRNKTPGAERDPS